MNDLPDAPSPRSLRASLRRLRREAALFEFALAGALVISICVLVYVLSQESPEAALVLGRIA